MIRIPNRGLHDLISAPSGSPYRYCEANLLEERRASRSLWKKGSLVRLRKLDGRSSTRFGLSNKSFAAQTSCSVMHSEYWQSKVSG